MATATLTMPDEVRTRLDRFAWINWSEVAREEFTKKEKQLEAWEEAEKILSKSKLTQEQADKLSDEFNWRMSKKYHELSKKRK